MTRLLLVLAIALGTVACGDTGADVAIQNTADLAYPAVDDEPTLQALYQRLSAAAAELGPPAVTFDTARGHHVTWCLPPGTPGITGALGGPACTATGPDAEELTVNWFPADPTSVTDPAASIEVDHRTDRYRFTYETMVDNSFQLDAPGHGSFPIVAATYVLDVAGTTLPPLLNAAVADSARQDLLAYLTSADGLTAHAVAKLESLRAEVHGNLDRSDVERQFNCRSEPSPLGEGTDRRCDTAELTDAERHQLHAGVDADIDVRIAEVRAQAPALYPILVEATLADRCPACWG